MKEIGLESRAWMHGWKKKREAGRWDVVGAKKSGRVWLTLSSSPGGLARPPPTTRPAPAGPADFFFSGLEEHFVSAKATIIVRIVLSERECCRVKWFG